jgi:hypothetical protein
MAWPGVGSDYLGTGLDSLKHLRPGVGEIPTNTEDTPQYGPTPVADARKIHASMLKPIVSEAQETEC